MGSTSDSVMTDSLVAGVQALHYSALLVADQLGLYTGGTLPTIKLPSSFDTRSILLLFAPISGAQTKILYDSTLTPPISAANTARIVQTVITTLEVSVPAAAETMMAKKEELEEAGLLEIARDSLVMLLRNHNDAGRIAGGKLDKSNKQLGERMEQELVLVTGKIEEAVRAFGGEV